MLLWRLFGFCRSGFWGREYHAEFRNLDLCASLELFNLFFEVGGEFCIGLFGVVKVGVEFSYEADLGRIPFIFVPAMFVEEA
jgi:hypothetical protein